MACSGVLTLATLIAPLHAPARGRGPSGAEGGAARVATASDPVPRDPALRTGVLANGMHYYIRANRTPAKRAFLWLAVNAGSVQEDEDQRGFAHFLEHMAFNGTTHFPRHALLDCLQLAGMRFGADINAETSYDQTVYKLEVPTDDGKSLDRGLTMLQDWANGGITIDSSEVLAERGVVLGEWRSRLADTLTQHVQAHLDSTLYGPDSRYVTRPPIGPRELIEHAEPGPIRRFYRDWYRPDLMAVIAVGDFDAKRVEREIRARFRAIPRAPRPRPRVSPRLPSSAEPVVDVYRGLVPPSITVLWKQPVRIVTTRAAYRDALIEELLFRELQRRLRQLAMRPGRPFIAASVGRGPLPARESAVKMLWVTAWPTDSLEHGLAVALAELERVARHGVLETALARQKAALLRRLEGAVTDTAVRPSGEYVSAYVDHYLQGGGALPSATQELALARAVLPTITSEDLARAARFWRTGADRLTLVQFPEYAHERIPTAAAIAAIFDSVAQLDPVPDSARAIDPAPLLAKRPAPGRIVGERRDPASGITKWQLSNGARVLFKPTHFDPNELLIRAVSPGGTSLLPDSLFFSPGRMVAEMMTQAAGLGTHDRLALDDRLSTTGLEELQVELSPTEEGIRLAGSSREIETLFQMLYLQFTAPKLDATALTAWKQTGTPRAFSLDEQLDALLSNGNPRLAPASWALAPLADTAQAMAVYRDRFGNAGDFTFIIVGATTAQQVKPLVERYLASLPSTGMREAPRDLDVHPWDRIMRRTARVFDIPKASTLLFYDGPFPTAPDQYLAERRRLDALSWVLTLKFAEDLREQMGGTYGVGVRAWTLAVPEEHYRLRINFDAAAERIGGMIDTMFLILDSVRANGATPSELAKVTAMQRRAREDALRDNHYWLATIELFDRLKIPFDRIVIPPRTPLTPADIRQAARTYLPTTAYIHLTYLPKDSTLDSAHDGTSRASPELAHDR
jgi:zinc protease